MTQQSVRSRIRAGSKAPIIAVWMVVGLVAGFASWFILGGENLIEGLRLNHQEALLSVLFATAGLACVSIGVFLAVRVRIVGTPTLACARTPFVPGDVLTGTIEARSNPMLESGAKVTVACLYITGGEDSTTTVIWADDEVVPAGKFQRMGDSVRIPVSFELSNDLPTSHTHVWQVGLHAGAGKMRVDATFPITVADPNHRSTSRTAKRANIQRKISVSQPGAGDVTLGDRRPNQILGYLSSAVFFILAGGVIWKGDVPFVCGIVFIGFAIFAMSKIVAYYRATAHSAIHIADGKITFSKGKVRLQEIDATSVREIEVIAGDLGHAGAPTYEVRLHTIGGKNIIAAPFVASRARAEAIARRIEDILTGFDRGKVAALFGDRDRLNSTP